MLAYFPYQLPDLWRDQRLMGIFEPQPLRLRALDLLFVLVGRCGVAQADGVPQVDLILQHLGDGSIAPVIWPCGVQPSQGHTILLEVVVDGGEDLLLLQLPGDLTGSPSGGAQLEDLPHHFSGFRVRDDLLGIVLCLLVAIAGPGGDPLPTLGLCFLHRPDFPTGVLGVKLVEQVFEWSKVVLPIKTVHIVIDGNKPHTIAGEYQFSIESGLQIISTNSAHVLYQNMSHLSSFNIGDQPLPCGTLKISSAPTVIGIVDTVRVTSLLSVAFEIFFLVHNRIAVANLVIVTGQSLVQCRNFLGIKSHSLFHAHDALLSDCRLICGDSIIPQVLSLVTVSLRIIRKILSSSVSPSESLNTTLTL